MSEAASIGETLIASALADPSFIDRATATGVGSGCFADEMQATFWRTLVDHRTNNKPVEVTAIFDTMARGCDLTERFGCDWQDRAYRIAASAPSITPDWYAGRLLDAVERQRLLSTLENARNALTDPTRSLDDVRAMLAEPCGRHAETGIVNVGKLRLLHPHMRTAVIEGLLRRGEICNVVSKSKIGKSWLIYGIALSIVSGRDWMGFPCHQGRVLVCDNELHAPTLANRIPVVAEAMGLRREDYEDRLDVLTLRGAMQDIVQLGNYFRTFPKDYYSACIIDAWYRAQPRGTDENSNGAATDAYNLEDMYSDRTGAAFMNVIHASKGNQSDKDVTDVGSGAGAMSRAADSHLILRPHEEEDCVVLEAAVRSWAPIAPLVLRWTFPVWRPATELDPKALKATKIAQTNEQRQQKLDGKRKRVMEYLVRIKPEGATKSAIKEHTGISVGLGEVLDSLVDDDNAATCEVIVGRNKQPYPGWKVKPDDGE